jgi:prefoldin alpha subunit
MEQEKQQEIIFRLSMFEQQIQQLQEQIRAVENGINELSSLNFGLDELKGKIGEEIMAPLGRGVFVKAHLASEDLTVDVGGQNFVKKSIPQTKEIIDEQIKKLASVRNELNENLEKMGEEMNNSLEEFREKAE